MQKGWVPALPGHATHSFERKLKMNEIKLNGPIVLGSIQLIKLPIQSLAPTFKCLKKVRLGNPGHSTGKTAD